MGKPLKDMTGMKFGKLTVVYRSPVNNRTSASWHCICDCENHTEVDVCGYQLRSGKTKSCGCLSKDRSKFIKDISGIRVGRLTVMYRSGSTKWNNCVWRCKCDCGNEVDVREGSLVGNSPTMSCGCLIPERTKEALIPDMVGERFGRLTVTRRIGSDKFRKSNWECLCDCGNITKAPTDALRSGGIKSCGCLLRDTITTHGMTHTKEYKRYKSIKRKELKILYDSQWALDMEIELRKMFKSCVVCGSTIRLSTAHVRALVRGNGLKPGNATILCSSCNSKQWAYPPENLPKSLPLDAGLKILESAQKFKDYWESTHALQTSSSSSKSPM